MLYNNNNNKIKKGKFKINSNLKWSHQGGQVLLEKGGSYLKKE